jgi:hypothetical protein
MDRYRALPGDDGNATRWTGAFAGSANSTIEGTYNNSCTGALSAATPESCFFWHHLRLAGFVAGTGATQPLNALTGLIGVQTGDGASGAALGGFTTLVMCSANLPDKIAIGVDSQMDDGVIGTGSVRAQAHTAPNPTTTNPAIIGTTDPVGPYQENGTNIYTICRQM